MIEEERNPRVHGNTVKAARRDLAHRLISPDSYRSVLRGEIDLRRARELGRDRGPTDTPAPSDGPERASGGPLKGRQPRPCLCSCGRMTKGGRFLPGHDARLHGELKRALRNDPLLRNERFSDEQRRYAVERGLVGPEVLPGEHDG